MSAVAGYILTKEDYCNLAQGVLRIEAEALMFVSRKIDENFNRSVDAILSSSGRVVVCGMGKSGHVGRKIVATLVSTGTPSYFMHPAEAFHGDLGMVLPGDVFLAISNSGETEEILKLVPFVKGNENILVAMTGNPLSTLASMADFHIDIGVEREACPLQLAPTASTTVTLAMGDGLAIALMKARGFRAENFARFHPGGNLGRKLLGGVKDFMTEAVSVSPGAGFEEILSGLSASVGGVISVVSDGSLVGVVTDGDVRRNLLRKGGGVLNFVAKDLMTKDPKVISRDASCSDADALMQSQGVNSLIVSDGCKVFVYQNINRKSK